MALSENGPIRLNVEPIETIAKLHGSEKPSIFRAVKFANGSINKSPLNETSTPIL